MLQSFIRNVAALQEYSDCRTLLYTCKENIPELVLKNQILTIFHLQTWRDMSLFSLTSSSLCVQINNMKAKFKETIEKCDNLELRLGELAKEKQSMEKKYEPPLQYPHYHHKPPPHLTLTSSHSFHFTSLHFIHSFFRRIHLFICVALFLATWPHESEWLT